MEVEVQYVLMRTLFIYGMLKQVMKFNPPINIIKMLKHNVKLRRFKIVLFQVFIFNYSLVSTNYTILLLSKIPKFKHKELSNFKENLQIIKV